MRFFNLDSPFMKFLNRMTDLLWLNLLTIVCSIPIVTAGAAFTALHYTCLKMVRDEEGYITKDYFKSFKQNFRQATIIWVIALLVAIMLIMDYRIVLGGGLNGDSLSKFSTVFFAAATAASIFIVCTLLYVFPILSHFENTIKGTIKNAFFMSILALPRTLLMLVLFLSPAALILMVAYFETMTWIVPIVAFFCVSAPAYFSAKLYNKTFKKFEPEESEKNDDFSWNVEQIPEEEARAEETTDENAEGTVTKEPGKMEE